MNLCVLLSLTRCVSLQLYRERFALRRQSEAWRRGADADFLPPLLPHPFPAPPPSLHPHFPGVIGTTSAECVVGFILRSLHDTQHGLF